MLPNARMAAARAACDCDPAFGIAFCCWIVALPKIKLVIQGDCVPVRFPEFKCPRHEIMGW
jgi:hypothetical protein